MGDEKLELLEKIKLIQEIKPDICRFPRRLFGYLLDWFPDAEDMIGSYAEIFMLDVTQKLYQQLDSGKLRPDELYALVPSNIIPEKVSAYVWVLLKVENKESDFIPYIVQSTVCEVTEPNRHKINIGKLNNEKNAEEYYNMAMSLKTDLGIQDKQKYVTYLEQAAEKGHLVSMHVMALCCLKGKYTPLDVRKGYEYMKKCIAAGMTDCVYELCQFSKRIPGLMSSDETFEMLKEAAEAGIADAQYELGMLYYENAVEEDYEKAVRLFSLCADKNDVSAIYQLALCYRYGHGVKADINMAMELLRKAANLGHRKAKEIIGA